MGASTLNANCDSRELSDLAERQIRKWALGLESRQRSEQQVSRAPPSRFIHGYVAISGETGVGIDEIAKSLAKKLGWEYLAPDLLDYLVEQYDWPHTALDYVNEQAATWFQEKFGGWLDQRSFTRSEYINRLGNIVLLAAQYASYVFVGRGAQFMLPSDAGLAVRLVAPKKCRVKTIAERHRCNLQEAEKIVRETDESHADFVQQHFRRNVADSHVYDLVVNLEHTAADAVVDLILGNYMLRFEPRRVWCAFRVEADRSSQRL